MSTPKPKNTKVVDHAAESAAQPAVDAGAHAPGSTHAAVHGKPTPRLPHERDESADSGTREPDDIMKKAADDMDKGAVDRVRSPATQKHYSHLAKEAQADEKRKKSGR